MFCPNSSERDPPRGQEPGGDFEEDGLRRSRLGTAGGGPARPLRRSSQSSVELYVRFDIWVCLYELILGGSVNKWALCIPEARFVLNLCGEWQDWFYLEIDPTVGVYFTEMAPFNLVASCIRGQHCELEKEGAEKTSKMSLKGLIEMASLGEVGRSAPFRTGYEWVKEVVWCIPSKFVDAEGVRRLGPPSSWVRNGEDITIEFCRALLPKGFVVKDLKEIGSLCTHVTFRK
ncbi:hypothetical protein PIB30_020874 [Stylosanthes scabra]|uniref:Uncharacterized protein n=1 Tax=Stylosanthes scabra TaxID=79078 RepID=A0ABU6WAM3_9FABA|nr:hypothetical protein [Stylosanthes scabra]